MSPVLVSFNTCAHRLNSNTGLLCALRHAVTFHLHEIDIGISYTPAHLEICLKVDAIASMCRTFQRKIEGPEGEVFDVVGTRGQLYSIDDILRESGEVPPSFECPERWRKYDTDEENSQEAGNGGFSTENEDEDEAEALDDDQNGVLINPNATPEVFVFTNIKRHSLARTLFAYKADPNHASDIRLSDFLTLMRKEPLSCVIATNPDGTRFAVTRPARQGHPRRTVHLHKVHGRNGWLERHMANDIGKRLCHKFGWQKRNFLYRPARQ